MFLGLFDAQGNCSSGGFRTNMRVLCTISHDIYPLKCHSIMHKVRAGLSESQPHSHRIVVC